MAISVTQSELKELLGEPSTIDDHTVSAEIAVLIVTEDLATSGLTEARRNKIALLLAAHFVTLGLYHGGFKRQEAGEASESYQDLPISEGLGSTLFGQQAKALDYTGTLVANTTTNLKAVFSVIQPTVQ